VSGDERSSTGVAVHASAIHSVFVSYTREDEKRVAKLLEGLERIGYRVWYDHDLSGGQAWWETILDQIRGCDALLLAVSPAQLESQACRSEVNYARKLGKSVLPVLIQEVRVERLPAELAMLQLVDYTGRSENEAFEMMAALRKLSPPGPLPDPLPASPSIPMSYVNQLADLVDATGLTLEQQWSVVGQLKAALDDPEDRDTALNLLRRLRKRQDIYQGPANEIRSILDGLDRPQQQLPPPPPPPPPPPTAPKTNTVEAITILLLIVFPFAGLITIWWTRWSLRTKVIVALTTSFVWLPLLISAVASNSTTG